MLCTAAICSIGSMLTSCDKKEEAATGMMSGTVTCDTHTMSVKSAFYTERTSNEMQVIDLYAFSDVLTEMPDNEPSNYIGITVSGILSGTAIDLSKALTTGILDFNFVTADTYFKIASASDGFMLNITPGAGGTPTNSKVTAGTFKYTKTGARFAIELNATAGAHRFTANFAGTTILIQPE